MEFYVSLVSVLNKGYSEDTFNTNFIHVKDDFYIFEGDIEFVQDNDGVELVVVSEGAVPSLGGLSQKELIKICDERLGVEL